MPRKPRTPKKDAPDTPAEQADNRPAWQKAPDFDAEERKYDPEEFYVPPADTQGHHAKEYFRCMPAMAGEMDLILQNFGKLVGWQSKTDFIRWAVNRGIHLVHRLEPTMPKVYLGSILACQEILTQDYHRSQSEKLFHTLFDQAEYHIQRADYGEVVKVVAAIKRALRRSEDCAWKRRAQERFDRQYGHWLNPSAVVTIDAPKELPPAAPPGAPERPQAPDDDPYEEPED